ncbi:MAG TPA: hypothetical protein VIQ30_23245, partial [Pseudonocardia sp.]
VRILMHAPGPEGHGVVRHAATVARLAAAHGVLPVASSGDPRVALSHAHFTDALYGPDITVASAVFEAWAAAAPHPIVVTLHDVPGADPDPARDAARRAGYARVVAVCDAAVVSAEHEAAKMTTLTDRPVHVIELPMEPLPDGAPTPGWADRPTLGLLGFVYPGKGHAEMIEAAARQPSRPRVVAAGTVSPGHTGLLRDLTRRARSLGVDLVLSGPLSDSELAAAADAITVPLAPNRRVSASGSLLAWLSRGRRPVTAAGEYAVELDRRHPGALKLYYGDVELDRTVTASLEDPASTRIPSPSTWPDVGAAHAALYRRLAER